MADPISIIGLIGQAAHVLNRLYDYIQACRGARKEVYDLYTEISALKSVLEQIEQRQNANQQPEPVVGLLQSSAACTDSMESTSKLLQTMLDDLAPRKENPLAALVWMKHKSTVMEQAACVERAKSFFVLVLMNDTSVAQQDLLSLVRSISARLTIDRQNDEDKKKDERHDRIIAWLAPFNPSPIQEKLSGSRLPGTGLWFINGCWDLWFWGMDDDFRSFCAKERQAAKKLKISPKIDFDRQPSHTMSDDARLLFLSGPMGSGKSMLCSLAVETAMNLGSYLAYYYFSSGQTTGKSCSSMLGSILSQLSRFDPDILDGFQSTMDHGGILDDKGLVRGIVRACQSSAIVYIFVDAINESSEEKSVVLMLFRILQQAPNVRVMMTSTSPTIRLSPYLKELQANVYLRPENVIEDMTAYAAHRTETEEPTSLLSFSKREDLINSLTARADGMFLYAACQLDTFACLHTGREVLRAAGRMPTDLFDIYQDKLARVPREDRTMVREALLWLFGARGPLTLNALAEAVVLEIDDTDLDSEMRLPHPQDLIPMCRGLIDHDAETDEIFFSHTSIRAFLCAQDTDNSKAWFNLHDTESASQHLLMKCLTYLLFDEFQVPCSDKITLDTRLRSYPLLEHAAKTWPEYFGHGDLVESQVEKALRLMDSRNASGGQYASWIQVLINDVSPNVSLTTEPLYYAASFGLLPLVEHLVKKGATVDAPGGRAQATPLQVACFRNHYHVAEFLLSKGADANSKNCNGLSNLDCANLRKNESLAWMLVQHGALASEHSEIQELGNRHYHAWSRCCQCGGSFAWGSVLYGACEQCRHSICEDCEKLTKRR